VIGFADYIAAAGEFVRDLGRFPDADPVYRFPCQDGIKVRDLSVLSCPDLVQYSAAAVLAAATTNRMLSEKQVYSHRLHRGPPRWSLRDPAKRWIKFRRSAIALLESGDYRVMRQEDIKSFFASVRTDSLIRFLRSCGCAKISIRHVQRMLTTWQSRNGVPGLPIGPEASALLANGLLAPVDQAIIMTGAEFRRWADDTLIFAWTLAECDAAVEAATVALAKLGLRYSPEKSLPPIEDTAAAVEHITDHMLESLGALHRTPALRDAAIAAVESEIEELEEKPARDRNPKHLGFLLNRMRETGNRFAVPLLATNPDLANLKPAASGSYLLTVGPTTGSARDDMFSQLVERRRGSDTYDALDLHLIRALGERGRLGTTEGKLFESIALDPTRRAPLRSWAWKAWGRSDAWTEQDGAEAGRAETDEMVRRAALVPFKGKGSPRRARLLRHMRECHPDLRYTTQWVESAA